MNRNVALVKKRLNPPPRLWMGAIFKTLNAARIVFHIIEDSYCVDLSLREGFKENS